jgi:hypothetical protein
LVDFSCFIFDCSTFDCCIKNSAPFTSKSIQVCIPRNQKPTNLDLIIVHGDKQGSEPLGIFCIINQVRIGINNGSHNGNIFLFAGLMNCFKFPLAVAEGLVDVSLLAD